MSAGPPSALGRRRGHEPLIQPFWLRARALHRMHSGMASRAFPLDTLSAEERIELIGELWNSLDPACAAPVTDALAGELRRGRHETDHTGVHCRPPAPAPVHQAVAR